MLAMVDACPALKLIYNRLASLLQEPQLILGLIVFLGLALQKKPFSEIIAGIIKTIMGVIILLIGVDLIGQSLTPLNVVMQQISPYESTKELANWSMFIQDYGDTIPLVLFSAGITILLLGVRMMVSELISAFQGISKKLIPNAIPALDITFIFPFGPNAFSGGIIMVFIAGIAIPMVADTMGGFIQAFGGNDFGFWVIITKLIGSLL